MLSTKFHKDEGEFYHLVSYSMACTIENNSECAMEHGSIRFGSLDEVIKMGDLMYIDEDKEVLKGDSYICLVRGKTQEAKCSLEAPSIRRQ